MTVRYFISRYADGSVSHLARICETDTALWGEFYQAGHWVKNSAAMNYLLDDAGGEPISEAQALEVIKGFEKGEWPEPL